MITSKKNLKWLGLVLAVVVGLFKFEARAKAELRGPYAADTNTLFLFHLDEVAGGSVTTNVGKASGNAYTGSPRLVAGTYGDTLTITIAPAT